MLKAGFKQKNDDGSWNNSLVDYSEWMGDGVNYSTAYDANGNILKMQQWGLKLNTSAQIDNLRYTYYSNSNKLQSVIDYNNDAASVLGDFKTNLLHPQSTLKATITSDAAYNTSGAGILDYGYDVNGNLITDQNKSLTGTTGLNLPSGGAIAYNYLNLPNTINVNAKGNIAYTYDAGGNKLKKTTSENATTINYNGANYNSTITTTTEYISGFIYETKIYSDPTLNAALGYTGILQFFGQEEGRVRFKPVVGATPATFVFDYFIKDHLGNTRMVLTEETPTNYYPAATLEGTYDASTNSMVNYEKTFYNINSAYITPETSIASWPTETVANTKLYYNNNQSPASNVAPIAPPNLSYPTSCTPIQTDGSAKLYKLNATTNRTGLEFMIKVMAGDKIDIFGKSYFLNTATVNNTNSTVLDLATLMANMLLSPANAAASKGITSTQLTTINTGQVPSSFFRGANGETTTIPKAYINYIFFDEQFKYAGGGASRVGSTGVVKDHWYVDGAQLSNISAPRNGYIFVYVSNESNLDVFFDNLQVIHKPGPILEETHYYPFGLTMSGISSKAAGKMQNKEKTFQGQRFDDDLGLNWVQFKWRNHDPQIGRFIEIDPLSNKYVYNSTYAFSENKVTGHVELEGLEAVVTPDKRPYPERIPEKIKPVSPFPATTQPPSNSESTPKDKDVTEKKSTSVKAPLGEEPLFGKTATNKVTKETDIINTGALGDKITVSSFEGKVTGKEGIVATADGSTNNTGLDGGSVTVGPVILGVNSDFSITVGAGVFGYESHVSAGFGVGLGQASAGFSYTGSDKVIKGADLMVRPGLGSLAVAAVSVVAALLSPVGL